MVDTDAVSLPQLSPRPPRRKMRILCFGDSLTAGYFGMGSGYKPYAETLVKFLEMAFPECDYETVEDGKPGALVTHDFADRARRHCMYLVPATSRTTTRD
jgi:lysophospholipase L1-like esterase